MNRTTSCQAQVWRRSCVAGWMVRPVFAECVGATRQSKLYDLAPARKLACGDLGAKSVNLLLREP